MKKILLLSSTICLSLSINAQRYVKETFTKDKVKITQNIVYDSNYNVLTGTPELKNLMMDVYEPMEAKKDRPLIVYAGTGSFLPRYINQTATGAKNDSATVEMATQFAQKGYVVAVIEYRSGWNPKSPDQDVRTGTIINAAFKGMQDMKSCVRHIKASISNGNAYGVDTSKICIGGQGTGGYLSMAYATLDSNKDIQIDKFFNFTTNKPYVNTDIWGSVDGKGGIYNKSSNLMYSNNVQMAFNVGGALGDTSWLNKGEMPIICIHGIYDPFAPYKHGVVNVPGTAVKVIDVSGGHGIMEFVNKYGNNAAYVGKVNDNYTKRANKLNEGLSGLFPIDGLANGSAPWEWWDTTAISKLPVAYNPSVIIANGKKSNPFMSKARALNYIDTLQGYLAPRIAVTLGLENSVSVNTVDVSSNINVFPVPANEHLIIHSNWTNQRLTNVSVLDLNGKEVINQKVSNGYRVILNTTEIAAGIYMVKLITDNGFGFKKVVIE